MTKMSKAPLSTLPTGARDHVKVGDCSERWFTVLIQYVDTAGAITGNVSFGDAIQYGSKTYETSLGGGFATYSGELIPSDVQTVEDTLETFVTFSFKGQCQQGLLSIRNDTNKTLRYVVHYAPRIIKHGDEQ